MKEEVQQFVLIRQMQQWEMWPQQGSKSTSRIRWLNMKFLIPNLRAKLYRRRGLLQQLGLGNFEYKEFSNIKTTLVNTVLAEEELGSGEDDKLRKKKKKKEKAVKNLRMVKYRKDDKLAANHTNYDNYNKRYNDNNCWHVWSSAESYCTLECMKKDVELEDGHAKNRSYDIIVAEHRVDVAPETVLAEVMAQEMEISNESMIESQSRWKKADLHNHRRKRIKLSRNCSVAYENHEACLYMLSLGQQFEACEVPTVDDHLHGKTDPNLSVKRLFDLFQEWDDKPIGCRIAFPAYQPIFGTEFNLAPVCTCCFYPRHPLQENADEDPQMVSQLSAENFVLMQSNDISIGATEVLAQDLVLSNDAQEPLIVQENLFSDEAKKKQIPNIKVWKDK
uniref:Uncharacterized protein n=1 Tax=Romanomermis culicivorax TaxID=13658 RepID=A0A915IPR5_ROMCU